jgi:hypothetical protein
VLQLLPSEHLSQAEIDAAKLVRFRDYNPQAQQRFDWPAHPVVAHAYLDQLQRNGGLTAARLSAVRTELDRVERITDANQRRSGLTQLATRLDADARDARDADRVRALAGVIRELAGAAR